jgi:hypothetical protein
MGGKIIPRARLERVESLYLGGHSEREIQRVVADEFGVTKRSVRSYLALVRKKLAEAVRGADPDETRARVEGMILTAYRTAERGHADRGPDPKAMVQAAKVLGDLHGVIAPQKIEHSGSIGIPAYDDLQRRLAAIAAGDSASADAVAVGEALASGSGDPGEGAG